MSIWIPVIITLLSILGWLLLIYPGKLRAEASMLATLATLIVIVLVWIAYVIPHLWRWVKQALF